MCTVHIGFLIKPFLVRVVCISLRTEISRLHGGDGVILNPPPHLPTGACWRSSTNPVGERRSFFTGSRPTALGCRTAEGDSGFYPIRSTYVTPIVYYVQRDKNNGYCVLKSSCEVFVGKTAMPPRRVGGKCGKTRR